MTRFFKTTAVAALALTTAMPAFAATYDISTMTCTDYKAAPEADQSAIALAAVMELSNSSDATIADNNGTATATAPLEGETAEESTTGSATTSADNNGEATATTTVPAGDDMTRFAEEIAILDRTCDRNMDATLMEAAAGLEGTR
jgi:hypothetical protein